MNWPFIDDVHVSVIKALKHTLIPIELEILAEAYNLPKDIADIDDCGEVDEVFTILESHRKRYIADGEEPPPPRISQREIREAVRYEDNEILTGKSFSAKQSQCVRQSKTDSFDRDSTNRDVLRKKSLVVNRHVAVPSTSVIKERQDNSCYESDIKPLSRQELRRVDPLCSKLIKSFEPWESNNDWPSSDEIEPLDIHECEPAMQIIHGYSDYEQPQVKATPSAPAMADISSRSTNIRYITAPTPQNISLKENMNGIVIDLTSDKDSDDFISDDDDDLHLVQTNLKSPSGNTKSSVKTNLASATNRRINDYFPSSSQSSSRAKKQPINVSSSSTATTANGYKSVKRNLIHKFSDLSSETKRVVREDKDTRDALKRLIYYADSPNGTVIALFDVHAVTILSIEFVINNGRNEGEDAVKLISNLVDVLKQHQVIYYYVLLSFNYQKMLGCRKKL